MRTVPIQTLHEYRRTGPSGATTRPYKNQLPGKPVACNRGSFVAIVGYFEAQWPIVLSHLAFQVLQQSS